MLIILFGLSGSGKNYVGEILAKRFGYYFWDADEALPADMRAAIQQKNHFTQAMRDQFTDIIANKIKTLKINHPNLVIAQGLYKEENRATFQASFPEAQWIWIKARPDTIRNRLANAHLSITPGYAEKIRANFETPQHPTHLIQNDKDEAAVVDQLLTLFPVELTARQKS